MEGIAKSLRRMLGRDILEKKYSVICSMKRFVLGVALQRFAFLKFPHCAAPDPQTLKPINISETIAVTLNANPPKSQNLPSP